MSSSGLWRHRVSTVSDRNTPFVPRRRLLPILLALLLALPAPVAYAQLPTLQISPDKLPANDLNGATITLIPKNATFFGAGEGGGDGTGVCSTSDQPTPTTQYVLQADLVGGKIPHTPVQLSAAGLAQITLEGAPAGLTITGGRLLARQANQQAAHGVNNHRSVELTLAYTGGSIATDTAMRVVVGDPLIRRSNQRGPFSSRPAMAMAYYFVIKAAAAGTDGVTVRPTSADVDETFAYAYYVDLDTDPGDGVTVTVTPTSTDTDALTVQPTSLTFTGGSAGNWDSAQTFRALTKADGDVNDQSITISHATTASPTTNPYHNIDTGPLTVNVTDAGHGVTATDYTAFSHLFVTADGISSPYFLGINSDPGGTVTITPASSGPSTAMVSGTYSFDSSNWKDDQRVDVTGHSAGTTTITHAIAAPSGNPYESLTVPDVDVVVGAVIPTITIADGNPVTEGAPATFTVHSNPTPSVNTDVFMRVTDVPNSDFLPCNEEGSLLFRVTCL